MGVVNWLRANHWIHTWGEWHVKTYNGIAKPLLIGKEFPCIIREQEKTCTKCNKIIVEELI